MKGPRPTRTAAAPRRRRDAPPDARSSRGSRAGIRWVPAALRFCCLLQLLLAANELLAVESEADFVRKVQQLGLPRLAQVQAERSLEDQDLSEPQRLELVVLLQGLCLDAAALLPPGPERQELLRRAGTCQQQIRSLGAAAGPAQELDRAIAELRWVEAQLGEAAGAVAERARLAIDLDRILSALDRAVRHHAQGQQARVEALPPERWEADPIWREQGSAHSRGIYHRAWARWHRAGLLDPGERLQRQELLAGAMDDLVPFTGGSLDDALTVRAIALFARAQVGYGQTQDTAAALAARCEALGLLNECFAGNPPPKLAVELLCAAYDQAPMAERARWVVAMDAALLQIPQGDSAGRGCELRILDWTAAAAPEGDRDARRRGIRLAERMVQRGDADLGLAISALAKLTEGGQVGDARLAPLLAAEQALVRGDWAAAALGYRQTLAQREHLPPLVVAQIERCLVQSLLAAGRGGEALAALDATARPADAELARRLDALLPNCLHAAWQESGGAWDHPLTPRLLDLLQDRLKQPGSGAELAELTCATALRLAACNQAVALTAAESLLDACAAAGHRPRELDLLRRVLPVLAASGPEPAAAEKLLQGLLVADGGIEPGVLAFAALALASACEGRMELATVREQAASTCRKLPGLAPALRRQALCHQIAAALDQQRATGIPGLVAELLASPAADAWDAALCERLAGSLRQAAAGSANAAALRQQAAAALRRALAQAAPGSARAAALSHSLAEVLVELGDGDAAAAAIAVLPEEFRDRIESRRTAALGHEAAGEHAAALPIWRGLANRLVVASPAWLEAKRHVAACLLAAGEAEEALRLLRYTAELYPLPESEAAAWRALERRCGG